MIRVSDPSDPFGPFFLCVREPVQNLSCFAGTERVAEELKAGYVGLVIHAACFCQSACLASDKSNHDKKGYCSCFMNVLADRLIQNFYKDQKKGPMGIFELSGGANKSGCRQHPAARKRMTESTLRAS